MSFQEEEISEALHETSVTEEEVLDIVRDLLVSYLDEEEAEFVIDQIECKIDELLLKKQTEFLQ